jgi:hypothetical protein
MMEKYQYQAALERIQQLDEEAEEYGEHRLAQFFEVDTKNFREMIEHAQELEHTNAQPLWQRMRKIEEEHNNNALYIKQTLLPLCTYHREVISKQAKENADLLEQFANLQERYDTLLGEGEIDV